MSAKVNKAQKGKKQALEVESELLNARLLLRAKAATLESITQ